jgi:hypothetical protein
MGDAMDFRCDRENTTPVESYSTGLLGLVVADDENTASFAQTGSGQTDGKFTQHRLFLFLFCVSLCRDNLGEAALMAYINKLSHDGAALMVQIFKTSNRGINGLVAPSNMQATMHNVIAPTTGNATNQAAQCGKISALLGSKYRVQIYAGVADTIPCFLRVHAQIYLELSDYRMLAEAVLAILSSSSSDDADGNDGGQERGSDDDALAATSLGGAGAGGGLGLGLGLPLGPR